MLPFGDVNVLSVLLASAINMIVGSMWYSPSVFGKMWMNAAKVPEREVTEAEMRKSLLMAFGNNAVMTYFLGLLLVMTGANDVRTVIGTVLVTAVATIIPYETSAILWEKRVPDLMVVNAGFSIVSMLISGLVFVSL